MSKIVKILLFCLAVFLLLIPADIFFPWKKRYIRSQSDVPQPVQLQLSDEEQTWLKSHQPIRVAFDGHFPPYSFIDDSNHLAGISFDTLKLISERLKIKISVDTRTLWSQIYQAIIDKEVDVIASMVNRPERQHLFVFTTPYVFKSLVIVTHKTNDQITDRSHLAGATVALVKNYYYSQRILDEYPGITPFYVDNMRDALVAVETQQADAAISFFAASSYLQNKYLFAQIKFAAFYDRNSSNESIAVRNDYPILAKILQKGLNSLTERDKQIIRAKWHPQVATPIDYETISKVVLALLLMLLVLLIWIGQIKRQNLRIKSTRNILKKTNQELEHLKANLENQVLLRTEQLQKSEQKFRSLVENLQDEYFFYKHDTEGVFTYLSPSITTILGYSVEEFLTHYTMYQTDHPKNKKTADYTLRCLQGEKIPAYEVEVWDKKGFKRCIEILESPEYDNNQKCIGIEGIAHDITVLKETQDRLSWLSYYDDLTGLANRRLFTDRLEQLIILSNRKKEPLALFFLDIDRFKLVNDSLGHAAGDEVLKETATRLQSQLRDSDVAARMGGDEFTLILPNTSAKAAKIVVKKLLNNLLKPYILNDQQFILGSSIGIAMYPEDASNAELLLQHADNAMYAAKKGKKGYIFCSSGLQQNNRRRFILEKDLRIALAQDCYLDSFELKILFQSKINIPDNSIQGYEALMRWYHPDLGLISPIEFIPLAEDSGLIVDLSRWVITKVCMQTVQWSQSGADFGKISINISAVELINFELANIIIKQIDATGAKREWLEIELTESALMKSPDVAISVMQQLVKAGILMSIDDFGTGYSSLSYLKHLPASYIKIDQSFIFNLLNSPEDQAVVLAVLAMAHALGKKVIAEGVETQDQLDFLVNNNCDMAQGNFFSKPIVAEKLFIS